ncbi:uncharacterized protein LOC6642057 [Drosophila willistoni]|nr:uncharacterized protein LOC6642057 [Drosophila willistoni]
MKLLQSLDFVDLEELRKLYSQDWPKYCTEVFSLNFFIDLLKKYPNTRNVKAYTIKDQELGLFLIVDRYQLFVGCLEGEKAQLILEQALRQLDWSRGLQCSSLRSRYLNAAAQVVQEKQLPIDFKHTSNLYHLKHEDALYLTVDPPIGFYLKALDIQNAQLIDEMWQWSHPGSLYYIQRQISMCPSVGLYHEETHELVAWCIRSQDGFLAALHVKEAYQRRGFGVLVARELARRIAQLGQDVTAEVYAYNKASVSLFNKLGFRVIDQCHWLSTKSTIKDVSWPDGE